VSATEPEQAAIAYTWSVLEAPPGANAQLGSPNGPNCPATGLTAAGSYTFHIELRDPTHVVSNDLVVTVHPSNGAPVIASASSVHEVGCMRRRSEAMP
jgi:hypothetical protein